MSGETILAAIMADQQESWSKGGRTRVESYLEGHPSLRAKTEDVLDLIYHEVVLRERAGESPTVEEYIARFPHLTEQLRDQFDVHHALPASEFDAVMTRDHRVTRHDEDHERPPCIPEYEILDRIGHGGMGVVYRARHKGLKRVVAIKVLRDWASAGAKEKARLRHEAEAVARLQHPNVVQVFDVGEVSGCPYLALEFVEGGSLDTYLAGVPQPPLRSARLLETIARAVHAAHKQDLIHCDLKPANVLLQKDKREEKEIVPKIADFGLARRLDVSGSRSERITGTFAYMAPEQAAGRTAQIGPHSDVHALGAMLYEMLTGRPPFLAASWLEVLRQVEFLDPVPLRRLQSDVPADLETICLKCLQKDPTRRYHTAEALADDLARFAAGRPIAARPVSTFEKATRWCRRNKLAAALLLGFTLAVLAGTTGTGVAAYLATRRAGEAENARDDSREQTRVAKIEEGKAMAATRDATEAKKQVEVERDQVRAALYETLLIASDRAFDRHELKEAARFLDECPESLRRFEWYVRRANIEGATAVLNNGGFAAGAAFTSEGKEFVTCGGPDKPLVRFHDAITGQLRDAIPMPAKFMEVVTSVGLSHDGKWVAVHSVMGTLFNPADLTFVPDGSGTIRVYDRSSKLLASERAGSCFAFSPDGSKVAIGYDKKVTVIDLATGTIVRTVGDLKNTIFYVGWHPNGKVVKAAGRTRPVFNTSTILNTSILKSDFGTWYLDNGKRVPLPDLTSPSSAWTTAALTPEGRELAADDQQIQVSHALDNRPAIPAPFGTTALAVSPDGKRLAAGGRDGVIRVFDLADRKLLLSLHGHRAPIRSVAYSPDGAKLLTVGGRDGTFRIWDANSQLGGPALLPGVRAIAFHAEGKVAAFPVPNGDILVWDLAARRVLGTLPAKQDWARYPLEKDPPVAFDVVYRTDGKLLAVYSDGRLRVWDVEKRTVESELELVMVMPIYMKAIDRWHAQGYRFSADARWIAGFTRTPPFGFCVFSTVDGHRVVEANAGGFINSSGVGIDTTSHAVRVHVDSPAISLTGDRAWSLETGKIISAADRLRPGWESVSADGSRVALVPEGNGPVQILDAASKRVLVTLTGARPYSRAVFSPNGKWLIAITDSGIELYDATQKPLLW